VQGRRAASGPTHARTAPHQVVGQFENHRGVTTGALSHRSARGPSFGRNPSSDLPRSFRHHGSGRGAQSRGGRDAATDRKLPHHPAPTSLDIPFVASYGARLRSESDGSQDGARRLKQRRGRSFCLTVLGGTCYPRQSVAKSTACVFASGFGDGRVARPRERPMRFAKKFLTGPSRSLQCAPCSGGKGAGRSLKAE
jgi:hypothetical protein